MNPVFANREVTNTSKVAGRVNQKKRVVEAPIKQIKSSFSKLQSFWKDNMELVKDHLPVPPRQGLVWDAVKHRWVRPEKAGLTVAAANNGKIRRRGTGTGAAAGSISRKRGMERFLSQRRGREASIRRKKG